MHIGLRAFESWESNNQRWRSFLGLGQFRGQVYTYQGLGHALFEITQGLRLFLPHKRSLEVFTVGSPYLMALLPAFYRESYQVALPKWSELANKSEAEIGEWIEGRNKDMLLFVAHADHSFTAEKYPTEKLRPHLMQKRIPLIEVFHRHPGLPLVEPEPFNIHIYIIDAHRCIAVIGSRLRFHPQVAPLLNWEFNQTLAWSETQEEQKLIEDFESHLQAPMSAYFQNKKSDLRVFDRAVINLNKINGDLFINEYSKLTAHPLAGAGKQVVIETSHLCRWGGIVTGPWWTEGAFDQNETSKVIMLSLDAVRQSSAIDSINKVLASCLRRQKII